MAEDGHRRPQLFLHCPVLRNAGARFVAPMTIIGDPRVAGVSVRPGAGALPGWSGRRHTPWVPAEGPKGRIVHADQRGGVDRPRTRHHLHQPRVRQHEDQEGPGALQPAGQYPAQLPAIDLALHPRRQVQHRLVVTHLLAADRLLQRADIAPRAESNRTGSAADLARTAVAGARAKVRSIGDSGAPNRLSWKRMGVHVTHSSYSFLIAQMG